MKKHAEQQHPEAFAEYSGLGDAEKNAYFDALVARNNALHTHFDEENTVRFVINKDIVEVIIGDMLFDPDDADASPTRARALEIFKLFEDADRTDGAGGEDVNVEAYEVKIASSRCFDLVLGYVSCGSLFRVTSRLVAVTKSCPESDVFLDVLKGRLLCTRELFALPIYKSYRKRCRSVGHSRLRSMSGRNKGQAIWTFVCAFVMPASYTTSTCWRFLCITTRRPKLSRTVSAKHWMFYMWTGGPD
jgi:hypothetical protein